MAYGFNDDKSKEEVYSRNDIDNAGYIKVDDIKEISLTGSLSIAANVLTSQTLTLQLDDTNVRKVLGVKRVRCVATKQSDSYDISPTKDVPVLDWRVYTSGQTLFFAITVSNRSGVAIKVNVNCTIAYV